MLERRLSALAAALAVLSLAGPAVAAPHAAASGVIVAVVDTGVDASEPVFAGRLVAGYDAIAAAADDGYGGWHGTATASVVVSVAPEASVMSVRALDAGGDGEDPTIARGVVWAVDHGARVINLSLEGPTEAPSLHAALRYAFRHGAVVVAAAGNDGLSDRAYPAADKFVLGVAATAPLGALYPWSNRGRWVTLAAPGVNASVVPGGGSFDFAGTSSAAAVVSGVAAACLAAGPTLPPSLVRAALVSTATPVAGQPFGAVDRGRAVDRCRSLAG